VTDPWLVIQCYNAVPRASYQIHVSGTLVDIGISTKKESRDASGYNIGTRRKSFQVRGKSHQ
jgi:hypothetical protein